MYSPKSNSSSVLIIRTKDNTDYIMKFYFIIMYDNKMYYLYGKINKAVDVSSPFSSIPFTIFTCVNSLKATRLSRRRGKK